MWRCWCKVTTRLLSLFIFSLHVLMFFPKLFFNLQLYVMLLNILNIIIFENMNIKVCGNNKYWQKIPSKWQTTRKSNTTSVQLMLWFVVLSVYKDVTVEDSKSEVILPCKILFPLPKGAKVEWKNFSAIVHVFENGSHQRDKSFVFYQRRTEMNENLEGTRDLSLTLKYPTDRDRAKFTCTVYDSKEKILWKKHVNLEVEG